MPQDHLLYFQFVGRFMGLAVLHGHFLDAAFTAALCKRILGAPFTIADLQEADPTVCVSPLQRQIGRWGWRVAGGLCWLVCPCS